MALSCFDDRASKPTNEVIRKALGASSRLWFGLIEHVAKAHPPVAEEWAFSGAQYGWSLRLVQKKRRLLYLIPQESAFLVGVVFGDKAFSAAMSSFLPKRIKNEFQAAKKYAEGRGIRFPVKSEEDLEVAKLLAEIKVEN